MSLDVTLTATRKVEVFTQNITHNLGRMAQEAGIYQALWHPEELGITHAAEMVGPLKAGLELMKADPKRFEALNPGNNWGSYEVFVPWIEDYLEACIRNPDAEVSTDT